MDKGIMIVELSANIEKNRNELLDLMQTYDLAKIGLDRQNERENAVYDRVFRNHEFFACRDSDYFGKKEGERLENHEQRRLLSKQDFQRFLAIANEYSFNEGLTDESGHYVEPWIEAKCEARRNLFEFILHRILPSSMFKTFCDCTLNVLAMDKLIDIIRKAVRAPDPSQTAVSPMP